MKKTITMILATVATAFALRAYGGTANVFCQNLGNLASPTDAQQAEYRLFLSTNNIDFGVFYGPTSAGNFGLTAEGYTARTAYVTKTSGGGRTLVYKTSAWRVAEHVAAAMTGGSKTPWCEMYLLERISNGEQFVFVFCTGQRFDNGTYAYPVRNYANAKADLYPGAWTLIGLPYANALGVNYQGNGTCLSSATIAGGYTRTLSASSTGAIFVKNHTTLQQSGSAVSLSFGSEPAAIATVTYKLSYTVTFNDWDGTELKTETVLEGGNATPPADPRRTDYVFAGWNGSYQNIQANVTLTAQYDLENSPGMIMMCW